MPAQSYTNTFGGETVNPALLSYIAYTITIDLSLVWPIEAAPDDNVAADKVDVTASLPNLGVTVPLANQASVGTDILFRNPGSNTYFVYDQDGIEIGQVASGQAWYFVLIDNSTTAGIWYAIQFGMGTSSATAASLAGAGLIASTSLLNQNLRTTALTSNYSVGIGDLATVLQNNGGANVYTFASTALLGNGWFVYVINAGTGSLVLTPAGGQTIDGSSTKTLAPGENAIIFCDGSNLHSLGYGRSIVTTVSGVAINVAGSGVISLTPTEITAQVQDWSGTLTGNQILDYGGSTGYWFVDNASSGAFTVTARTNSIDPGVAIPQGSFSIIRSNGTSMSVAFTASTGTVTSVATTANLTGGPITTTGTLDLSNTGVTAGSYGTATAVPTLAIDTWGRTTAATNTSIAITGSQVTDLSAIIAAALAAYLPTGFVGPYVGSTAPSGWILGFGTIGNAASGATNRANADTVNLYTLIWNSFADAQAPVSGGRGISSAVDYAANKTITVPDYRGRLPAGLDNMGGTPANRLTSATMSPDGNTMGASGGAETQVLITANLANHTHDLANHTHDLANHTHAISQLANAATGVGASANSDGGAVRGVTGFVTAPVTDGPTPNVSGVPSTNTSGATGTGTAFNKTQPTLLSNIIIRL